MATAKKTVQFAFPMASALVANTTVTNLSQITLYIPEASPVFRSVFVEVGFQDVITGGSGGTITEHRCGLRLGAAAYTTISETDDIVQSGENIAGVFGPFDFTSHFNANWTGTSMTCDLQVYFYQNTGTTLGMANVTAVVYATYEYSTTAGTQLKTVRIPLQSLTSSLPTTATNFGTSQIPKLTGSGGFLPENSPVIRDWFLLIEGNECNAAGTTNWDMAANIDGGATTTFITQGAALATDRFCRWIYRPSMPSTTATHNLQLWSSLASRAPHITVTLIVTYEFTLSGTTRLLNSILVPVEIASPLGATTTADASRFAREISIQEPGTIALLQSAIRINFNASSTQTAHWWRVGGQTYTTYATNVSVVAGMHCFQQRIDAGADAGAGITLARGFNEIIIDGYATSANNEMTNLNGLVILNYTSDLAADIGDHATTVLEVMLPWDALLTDANYINGYSFQIPAANYYVIAAGFCFNQWVSASSLAVTFDVQCLSGESKGAGYIDIYADAYVSDGERACSLIWMRGRDAFKRFPSDADPNRLDIETARNYRLYTTTTCGNGIFAAMTYHSHTWTVAGAISGNDAALPTSLQLIADATDEVVQTQTLSAGTTAFSFTVNDNTRNYSVSAYQDGTHVGRSAPGLAA